MSPAILLTTYITSKDNFTGINLKRYVYLLMFVFSFIYRFANQNLYIKENTLMTTGTLNTKATLYYGPGTTEFIPDISFPAGTQFNVLWQESSWYYVSVLGGARRNYVPKSLMTVTGAVPTYVPSLLPRRIHTYGPTRLGPTTNYPQNGSLNPDTTVHYLDTKKEGDFALIQIRDQSTGKYKRVWFEHMKVGPYSGPVNYRYISGTYGGVALHIIRTHANNIRLLDQTIGISEKGRKAMQDSGYFGHITDAFIHTGTIVGWRWIISNESKRFFRCHTKCCADTSVGPNCSYEKCDLIEMGRRCSFISAPA